MAAAAGSHGDCVEVLGTELFCLHCNNRFTEDQLLAHMRKVWNEDNLKREVIFCAECNVAMTKVGELRPHLPCLKREAVRQQQFACRKCKYSCKDYEHFQEHNDNFHNEFLCEICNRPLIGVLSQHYHTAKCDGGVEVKRKRVQFNDNMNSSLSPSPTPYNDSPCSPDGLIKGEPVEEFLIDEDLAAVNQSPTFPFGESSEPSFPVAEARPFASGSTIRTRLHSNDMPGCSFGRAAFSKTTKPYERLPIRPPRFNRNSPPQLSMEEELFTPPVHVYPLPHAPVAMDPPQLVGYRRTSLQSERPGNEWNRGVGHCENCQALEVENERLRNDLIRIQEVCRRSAV